MNVDCMCVCVFFLLVGRLWSYPGAIERSIGIRQWLDGNNTSSSLSDDALINGSHRKASGVEQTILKPFLIEDVDLI